jgi:competence protein ComEC
MMSKSRYLQAIKDFDLSNVFKFEIFALIYTFGILQYFYLPYEVKFSHLLYTISLLGFFAYKSRKRSNYFYIAALVFLLGILVARSHHVQTTSIDKDYKYISVQGRIEKIENLPKSKKFLLNEIELKGYSETIPKKIVIFLKKKHDTELLVGDKVQANVSLKRYNFPIIPSKIYLNIVDYYEGIGATSFAYKPPELLDRPESKKFLQEVELFRKKLNEKIAVQFGGDISGVIAALSIGERGEISEGLNDHIRNSGLSHLLSISGMHLSIVAGIFFVSIRYCLNLIPFINNRYDLKKIAAYGAMVGSLIYLLISGMKVATIRAYVMANIGLIAILTGNFYNLMRATCITLILLLSIKPIYVLSAAFQLSFAAVISIACFLGRRKKAFLRQDQGFLKRTISYLMNNAVFSLSAILGGFWISTFHFYQFSTYSVLSNLIAVPLTSVIIMPLIILLLLSYAVSSSILFKFFAKFLAFPVQILIDVATKVSELPYSTIFIGQVSGYIIVLGIIASLIALLFQNKYCWILSIILNICCLIYVYKIVPPNIIIDNENGNILILEEGKIFYINNNYSAFKKKLLKGAYNVQEVTKLTKLNKGVIVEKDKIILKRFEKNILILLKDIDVACNEYDLILNTKSFKKVCDKNYISKKSLYKNGNYYIFFAKDKIKILNSLQFYGKRSWI